MDNIKFNGSHGVQCTVMSVATESDRVTDRTEDAITGRPDSGVPACQQLLQDVDDRLGTLSERITMCNKVLTDLKSLSAVLQRKSVQDVSLAQQK